MMGSPSGVTHSTVRPDWAMSLALSVSQFFRRGEEAAGVSVELGDPTPYQHRQPSLLSQAVTVQRLLGSLAQSHTSGLGQEDPLWARRTISPHGAPPCLCVSGPGKKNKWR